MNTKPRSDAVLFKLSLEDQEKLNHWLITNLSYAAVQKLLAAPAPEGMNLKVCENTLVRYYERVIPNHIEARRKNAAATSRHLKKAIETDPNEFDTTTLDALKQRVFELTLSPESDAGAIHKLYRLVLRAKDQELAREKFEYNAAKAIMKNFDKIAKIMREKDKHTDRASLDRVRMACFGTLTDQEQPLTGDEWTPCDINGPRAVPARSTTSPLHDPLPPENQPTSLANEPEANDLAHLTPLPDTERVPSGNLCKSVKSVDQPSSSSCPSVVNPCPQANYAIGDAVIMKPELTPRPAQSFSDSYFDTSVEETSYTPDDTRDYKVKHGKDYFGEYLQYEYRDGHNPQSDTKYVLDRNTFTIHRRKEQ